MRVYRQSRADEYRRAVGGGRRQATARGVRQALFAALDERPLAPTEVNPRLLDAVDEILAKATAKDELTRYETAAAVRRDCWGLVRTLG